jgi:hypothetical protein
MTSSKRSIEFGKRSFGWRCLLAGLFGCAVLASAQSCPTPSFFSDAVPINGDWWLQLPDGTVFGQYNLTVACSGISMYHYDLGWEAVIDANDGSSGVWLYDYTSEHWWYTNPAVFPDLYDSTLGAWLYYNPDTSDSGHYTTNPRTFTNLTTNLPVTYGSTAGSTALAITSSSPLPGGITGVSYVDWQLTASGGTAPYSWSTPVRPTGLPPGLQLSAKGLLTGTPTAAGQYSFTVRVTDGAHALPSVVLSLTVAANAGLIGAQSSLEGDLGYMPFDQYNSTALASSNMGLTKACPLGSTVRGCYNTVLQNLKAQSVSGVRVFVTFCDVFHFSNALVNCGNLFNSSSPPTWNPNANPGLTWLSNVTSFFQDVKAAGIPKVTLTFMHADGSAGTIQVATSTTTSPSGSRCGDTPSDYVYFWVPEPFGLKMEPSGSLYPIGEENDGYNCAPMNPYFVGWNNQFSVIGAMLGAAESNQVTIDELEFENEIDLLDFSSHLRLVYDNASPELVGQPPGTKIDIVTALRGLMSAHGFDQFRVTWSTGWIGSTVALSDCINAYGDSGRAGAADPLAAAIWGYRGGWIGVPIGASASNGLYCGGSLGLPMQQSPFARAAPDIIDAHVYPAVNGAGVGESGTEVQNEASLDFTDIENFVAAQNLQPAPLVMVGETHQGTPSHAYTYGAPCAMHPDSAPANTVAGFQQSTLASAPIVFRPWMELWNDTGACYAYNGGGHNSYQNLNFSGTGPYLP